MQQEIKIRKFEIQKNQEGLILIFLVQFKEPMKKNFLNPVNLVFRWQGAQTLQAGDARHNLNEVITFSGGWLVDQIPQVRRIDFGLIC
jgi:hypothetical protein